MLLHRLLGRGHALVVCCLLGTNLSYVAAQSTVPGHSQLGGWVYVDRNNDGVLAFANDPHPEFVIGGVEIRLFSAIAPQETLVATTHSDDFGRYFFSGLSPGTYSLRETQPVEYVDGLDTLGILQSLVNQPVPNSASIGVTVNNAFDGIVLPAHVRGDYFNFGERGMAPGYVSKRYLLGSAPLMPFGFPEEMPIPEPATGALAWTALLGAWLVRRRRRR